MEGRKEGGKERNRNGMREAVKQKEESEIKKGIRKK